MKERHLLSDRFARSGKSAETRYVFEDRPCFCGAGDDVTIAERDRYGHYYPLVVCRRCGLIRANPRMSEESYRKFYEHEFRTSYGDDAVDKDTLFTRSLEKGSEVFSFIKGHIDMDSVRTVCDIGCHMGAMLEPFRALGKEVWGVDFDERYLEFGRKRTGSDRFLLGGAGVLAEKRVKADLIILNHVFEHFVDIEKELRTLGGLLAPGGHVFIAVPGTYWWIEHLCGGNVMSLLQNAHTYQFSLATLCYVMECCGFEMACGTQEIKALFCRAPRARGRDAVPAGEYEKADKYLRKIERGYAVKLPFITAAEKMGIKDIVKKVLRKKYVREG